MKCKKFKLPKGFILNYDNLYVIPSNKEEYIATYGDTQYTFNESEIDEICEKFNQVGCTSFQLSREKLLEIVEKLKEYS